MHLFSNGRIHQKKNLFQTADKQKLQDLPKCSFILKKRKKNTYNQIIVYKRESHIPPSVEYYCRVCHQLICHSQARLKAIYYAKIQFQNIFSHLTTIIPRHYFNAATGSTTDADLFSLTPRTQVKTSGEEHQLVLVSLV